MNIFHGAEESSLYSSLGPCQKDIEHANSLGGVYMVVTAANFFFMQV